VNPQIRLCGFGFAKQFAVAETSTHEVVWDDVLCGEDIEQFDGF
jgi:hypothetical protein